MKAYMRAGVAILAAASAATMAWGQTVTYQYDELGRLKASSQSGGARSGTSTSISYDPAGNRSNYAVSDSATSGGGTGGGGTTNNPPVANANSASVGEWQTVVINVVSNDTDPDGDYPLTIASINDPNGIAYVASASEIGWSGAPTGTYVVQYTVKDSRGATATGTLEIGVFWVDQCGGNICQ